MALSGTYLDPSDAGHNQLPGVAYHFMCIYLCVTKLKLIDYEIEFVFQYNFNYINLTVICITYTVKHTHGLDSNTYDQA